MISLIASMLRARRLQNVIVMLLATITIGAAVAVPAFIAAADNAIVPNEIGNATPSEQLLDGVNPFKLEGGERPDSAFAQTVPALFAMPGFSVSYADETDVALSGKVAVYPKLQFHQDECDHVVLVSGRCPVGPSEVMIAPSLAKTDGLGLGQPITLTYAVYSASGDGWSPAMGYASLRYTVVGIYRATDQDDPYWGLTQLFVPQGDRGVDAPMLGSSGSVTAIHHGSETQTVNAVISRAALTSAASLSTAQLDALATMVRSRSDAVQRSGAIAGSDIPTLIHAIERDRAALTEGTPIVAVPLIALGCFVLFLASGYAVNGRREELGVVALRGSRKLPRWWLGVGELMLCLLLALPCGFLLGYLTALVTARFLLPGHPSVSLAGPGTSTYVLAALAGGIIAIVAAAYRTMATHAVDLLRNVPARASTWRTVTSEAVIVALAVTALIQMRSDHAALSGIELVAPGLLLAAIAVLCARLVTPLASWYGSRGVRRGGRGLGASIGALQIARRPGAARVFVLLVVAVGLVTFTTFDVSISNSARHDRAATELGASEIVSVTANSRLDLLRAVDQVDPHGTFAMAAAVIPQPSDHEPPIIAVDSSRLATVAAWPAAASISAARAQQLLRPPPAKTITVTGEQVALTIDMESQDADILDLDLGVEAQPLSGTQAVLYGMPDHMRPGTHTYIVSTPSCVTGCRIAGITMFSRAYAPNGLKLTLKSFRVTLPTPSVVSTFDTKGQWRYVEDAKQNYAVAADIVSADGLTVNVPLGASGTMVQIEPVDSAYPVPVLTTARLDHPLQGQIGPNNQYVNMVQAGIVASLPRVGTNGILTDLVNVDRTVPAIQDAATEPEVWLNPHAPADVLNRLRAAGLTVLRVTKLPERERFYDRQGPGLGTRLSLIVIVGVILLMLGVIVLTASVDRRRRGDELRALRRQGLSVSRVRAAARFGYSGLAVAALVLGIVAGAVTWRITGAYVPVFVERNSVVPLPPWPQWTSLLWAISAVTAVSLLASAAASWDLRRVVRRGSQGTDNYAPRSSDDIQERVSVGSSR